MLHWKTTLFCLALIPLTAELNRTGYRYKIDEKSINHLFHMDDLILFAKESQIGRAAADSKEQV